MQLQINPLYLTFRVIGLMLVFQTWPSRHPTWLNKFKSPETRNQATQGELPSNNLGITQTLLPSHLRVNFLTDSNYYIINIRKKTNKSDLTTHKEILFEPQLLPLRLSFLHYFYFFYRQMLIFSFVRMLARGIQTNDLSPPFIFNHQTNLIIHRL